MFVHHQNRIPSEGPVLVASNHRSFMDAPILMAAINRPIRFACHRYMGQVPVLREIVAQLGCFPLEVPKQRQKGFFQKAVPLLQAREMVGIFPEGTSPMVNATNPREVGAFHRGFAHLAFKAPIADLAVLPVAIAAIDEATYSPMPTKVLSLFDPSEPLFHQDGWHPVVIYRRVNVYIGRPYWITPRRRESYRGKKGKTIVSDLVDSFQAEIAELLRRG